MLELVVCIEAMLELEVCIVLVNTNSMHNTNTNYTTPRTTPPLRAPSSPPLPARVAMQRILTRCDALTRSQLGRLGVTDTAVDTADDVVIRRLG